jgi:hypothetical protein
MNAPTSIRSAILLLGLPALWVGSYSISGKAQAPDLEFVPVAVHAIHIADYSVDAMEKLPPVDENIVIDMMEDHGITPPTTTVPVQTSTPTPTPDKGDDDEEDEGGSQATPPPSSNHAGGNGNGNDGSNGNDENNGKSEEEHGNGGGNGNGGNGNGNGKGNNK